MLPGVMFVYVCGGDILEERKARRSRWTVERGLACRDKEREGETAVSPGPIGSLWGGRGRVGDKGQRSYLVLSLLAKIGRAHV